MLYRTSSELVGCDVANSTYLPLPVSVTADRPTDSPARVSQLRFLANTTPLVVALAASCSTNGTGAPRPAVSEGADPATVGTAGWAACLECLPTMTAVTARPTMTIAASTRTAVRRRGRPACSPRVGRGVEVAAMVRHDGTHQLFVARYRRDNEGNRRRLVRRRTGTDRANHRGAAGGSGAAAHHELGLEEQFFLGRLGAVNLVGEQGDDGPTHGVDGLPHGRERRIGAVHAVSYTHLTLPTNYSV